MNNPAIYLEKIQKLLQSAEKKLTTGDYQELCRAVDDLVVDGAFGSDDFSDLDDQDEDYGDDE